VLGRLILVLEAGSKIFHEVFKPLLDVVTSENIVRLGLNLDEDSPIQKTTKSNLNCE
jgi:hypothetical protein